MNYPAATRKMFAFRGATAAVANTAWTKRLFKNGTELSTIGVTVVETSASNYVASFTDDGTDLCRWDLIVYPAAATTDWHADAWFVNKLPTDQNVSFIRSLIVEVKEAVSQLARKSK